MKIIPPSNIVIKKSPIHGWGVFASKKIKENEIIEVCYPVDMELDISEPSEILERYRFNWPQGLTPTKLVLPTGYGMIYNHSEKPNANWRSNFDNETFEFYALRDIEEGEEIFTWYGGVNYWDGIKSTTITVK